jgi:hypothetical protein
VAAARERSSLRCLDFAYQRKRPARVLGTLVGPFLSAYELLQADGDLMTLSEIEDVAVLAERACAMSTTVESIQYPTRDLRKLLAQLVLNYNKTAPTFRASPYCGS